jgi:hypothetical protein
VRVPRCELRDHINCRKNDRWPLVSILQGVAAAEIINTLHLRDFRSRAIFEFFNTIGAKRPLRCANINPACLRWLDLEQDVN